MVNWDREDYLSTIVTVESFDVRFPAKLIPDTPSDAMHGDVDFSAAYVILKADQSKHIGHGFTFTVGRGQEIVMTAIESLSRLVKGRKLLDIFPKFGEFWKTLTCEPHMRWIGPEKGAIHLATAALINALWDLWAKIEQKPLWKLLVDMDVELLLSTIDFRYITDVLSKEQAAEILKSNASTKLEREKEILEHGVPAYVTSVGWLGIPNRRIVELGEKLKRDGWNRMKMKVGVNLESDKERAGIIREIIGHDGSLMTDANQKWDVDTAIDWMKEMATYKPLWIEEPTSPDDVMGHAKISRGLRATGIGVATGEHCMNRVLFKQFLESGAMQFCQIDSCRLGGVNEVLSVLLLAKKFNVPVCPHAGGVGLCELVQHLAIFNFICVSPSWNNVYYKSPSRMPGYSAEFKNGVVEQYLYPNGPIWRKLS